MSTLETIRFRLVDGVSDEEFVRLNKKVENEYMRLRPGFVSRQSARSEAGEWAISVVWATVADAEATIGAFFGAPETQDFLAAVDKSTVVSGRYEIVEA